MAIRDRICITSAGAVTPLGMGVAEMWDGLLAGRSGIKPITLFDATDFRNANAGQVLGYEPNEIPRAFRMLADAIDETLRNADESARRPLGRDGIGLILGTNFGCVSVAQEKLVVDDAHGGCMYPDHVSLPSLAGYEFQAVAGDLARRFNLTGPRTVISLSCASGTAVIGLAYDWLTQEKCTTVLAAGFDELTLFNYSGLSALRSITPEIIRPFDARRKGTIFSEGAGCVLLELGRNARRRGQTPMAEVLGWAVNNDAFHMTAPQKEGIGIAALMTAALQNAGVQPDQVDHINAHATGTKYNDSIETLAIKNVFGDHAKDLTIAANKSCLGHGMGAAGTWESIATVLSIRDGKIAPTIHLEEPDPELDLNYCPTDAVTQEIDIALKCSYGFGGTNAAVVLKKVQE